MSYYSFVKKSLERASFEEEHKRKIDIVENHVADDKIPQNVLVIAVFTK